MAFKPGARLHLTLELLDLQLQLLSVHLFLSFKTFFGEKGRQDRHQMQTLSRSKSAHHCMQKQDSLILYRYRGLYRAEGACLSPRRGSPLGGAPSLEHKHAFNIPISMGDRRQMILKVYTRIAIRAEAVRHGHKSRNGRAVRPCDDVPGVTGLKRHGPL